MPAVTVTFESPPPLRQHAPGVLRPQSRVRWTGGTGPTYDVVHEWDTVSTFDSGNLIQVTNTGVSAQPDTAIPTSDLGPGGTDWHYRVRITDNDDAFETTSGDVVIVYVDPIDHRRYLYEPSNLGIGISPIDDPAGGWGPDPDQIAPDGFAIDHRRYLYELGNVGVGFDPTDTPPGGWGPEAGSGPGDGYTLDFDRFLYELAFVTTDVPTPHIWYVYPNFGREGWEFKVVGYGFGDTQATYNGQVLLNALGASVVSWVSVAQTDPNLVIDPTNDIAQPIHQEVRAVVPINAESGLVYICTDA